MLRARGEHQREFGLRRKPAGGGVQQHVADFLADGSTARFARDHDRNSHLAQRPRQLLQLRAFAAAIQSFDGDEPAALGMGRHGRIIAKQELVVRGRQPGGNGTRLCPVSPGSVVLLPSATCSSVTCELRRRETEWCYRQPPPHCTPGWSPVQTMPALVLSKERANRALLTALGSAVTLAVIFTIFDSNIEVARVPAGLYSIAAGVAAFIARIPVAFAAAVSSLTRTGGWPAVLSATALAVSCLTMYLTCLRAPRFRAFLGDLLLLHYTPDGHLYLSPEVTVFNAGARAGALIKITGKISHIGGDSEALLHWTSFQELTPGGHPGERNLPYSTFAAHPQTLVVGRAEAAGKRVGLICERKLRLLPGSYKL